MDEQPKSCIIPATENLDKFFSEIEGSYKLDLSGLSIHDADMEKLPEFLENLQLSKALTIDFSCNYISD